MVQSTWRRADFCHSQSSSFPSFNPLLPPSLLFRQCWKFPLANASQLTMPVARAFRFGSPPLLFVGDGVAADR